MNSSTEPAARPGILGKLLGAIPTLVVLAFLVGIALYGHHSGWQLPSSPLAEAPAAGRGDWCEEHNVPESLCVECKPELLPHLKDYGWCPVHGVPECPWEHPDVAQAATSAVTPEDLERAKRALALAPRVENNNRCKRYRRRIQLASQEAYEKAGLDVEAVERKPVTESVQANGEITYDQTRVARVSARVPGPVWRVTRQVGDRVRAGELLALVEAADVGRAKAEFLQALAQVELRARTLEGYRATSGSIPERTVREAETALREAEIRLATAEHALVNLGMPLQLEKFKGLKADEAAARVRLLGIPDDATHEFDARKAPANLLPLLAPLDGVVVSREVVAGEVVDTAKVLFIVADVRRMWVTLHVRLEDARPVALGQTVQFRPDGVDEDVTGKVNWISTAVDPQSRTRKVRADVDNRGGRLVDHVFGMGTIILRQESQAPVVPNEAIQSDGDCQVVFVRDRDFLKKDAPKVFHTRIVRLGARNGRYTEVIAGVLPGEFVATRGSNMLRTELLKENLGEG